MNILCCNFYENDRIFLYSCPYKKIKSKLFYKQDECSLCLSVYNNNDIITHTGCQHIFHKKCLDKWLKYENTCPLCRNILRDIY